MDESISKKELLKMTGISYGQLYRWKRENLIPDSWFDKRSVPSGQETFFPKELILNRIRFIVKNKDKYSLSQLQGQLSPQESARVYSIERLATLDGVEGAARAMYELTGKLKVNYSRALTIILVSKVMKACNTTSFDVRELMVLLTQWQKRHQIYSETDAVLLLVEFGGQCLPLFFRPEASVLLPDQAKVLFSASMNDLTEDILKLNQLCEEDYHVDTE